MNETPERQADPRGDWRLAAVGSALLGVLLVVAALLIALS